VLFDASHTLRAEWNESLPCPAIGHKHLIIYHTIGQMKPSLKKIEMDKTKEFPNDTTRMK
jgi:hypothetical protein